MTNAINTTFGQLAQQYCGKRLPLEVLQSQCGFYIGTFDDESGPCSRESKEYFANREAAELALAGGQWTQKIEP